LEPLEMVAVSWRASLKSAPIDRNASMAAPQEDAKSALKASAPPEGMLEVTVVGAAHLPRMVFHARRGLYLEAFVPFQA